MTAAIGTRETLSAVLKESTRDAHDRAEHSVFMDKLLGGELGMKEFVALQEQQWLFYKALEAAARAVADQPLLADIFDPELERVASLEHDLDFLHGNSEWREHIEALPATKEYIACLEEIAESKDAVRLIAHHYVRYLGDLSGGLVIGLMMKRHYDVDEQGITFYNFDGIPKVKPYKDHYRAALDALPLDSEDRERLLAEASDAFLFNRNVFSDLYESTQG